MGTKKSKIDRSKIISDTQKVLDQLDVEEMKNRELSVENKSLRKTKDVLLEGNSELINKIRQLNTDASLYKVHHFEDDDCCNRCSNYRNTRCETCDHYQEKDNSMCKSCVHYQGEQVNDRCNTVNNVQQVEQYHGPDCHCSKCCPNPNPSWFQRNTKGICVAILLVSIILLAVGWSPSGPVFDSIQKSWVELFVNFFKMAILAVAITVSVKILNDDKKKK